MEDNGRHRILLIEPSAIVARGLREILAEHSEFEVVDTLPDWGRYGERLTVLAPDAVVVDPCLFDFQKRNTVRSLLPDLHQTALVAILTGGVLDDELLKQYDGAFYLYDEPKQFVRKLRKAL